MERLFEVVLPHMNELQRRVVAGAVAEMLGRGGKTAVAEASGMSRNTVIEAVGDRHDPNWYPKGVRITDRQLAALPLTPHDWHGKGNYTLDAQSDLA